MQLIKKKTKKMAQISAQRQHRRYKMNILNEQTVKNFINEDGLSAYKECNANLTKHGLLGLIDQIDFFLLKESRLYQETTSITTHNMQKVIKEFNANLTCKCKSILSKDAEY